MNALLASSLDLRALSPLQRKIVVELTRNGPADSPTLAQRLALDSAEIEQAVASLTQQGSLRLANAGQVEVVLGQTRRRSIPARLWPALTASSRLYSAQEIATLRTVMPILQFARAKLSEFADHGPNHALRVKSFAAQLGYIQALNGTEQHLLRAAALFHDVGNIIDRGRHHIISQETVEKLTAAGELPFSGREAALIGLLCRWHRKTYDPDRCDEVAGERIRTGLLAALLRVADAMDIDQRRSDYTDRFARVLEFFYPNELPYWHSLEEILGVRIRCTPAVQLQVFTRGQVAENLQIEMLRGDLATTPLAASVQQIAVAHTAPWCGEADAVLPTKPQALLAFPFDPHSLVMAALSRRQLRAAGYPVELLCYPDTEDGLAWLWREALSTNDPVAGAQLVIINDRPVATDQTQAFAVIQRWQANGAMVTVLNRHEANWSRVPVLCQQGVAVVLGGDWAYFWGDAVSQVDLAWARIAALCTRDPMQAAGGLSSEEEAITQGLLNLVYTTMAQTTAAGHHWAALAAPILAAIERDDRAYFSHQASTFAARYTTLTTGARVMGRVLIFAGEALDAPQCYYWALEAAIERHGRLWERGLYFKAPYAIATWQAGDSVELLAINHWREESAIPIRLLYPDHLGPSPTGNEITIQVRLSAEQAERVIPALVDACNQK